MAFLNERNLVRELFLRGWIGRVGSGSGKAAEMQQTKKIRGEGDL
jgi:hypothetical protein